ncbi:PAS domain-containing sensor histidine kinase [Caballeronia insecticola]|uniref:histidine kinase n=1 Tax=Caballeronia insecticola TaxID=758793 RepID=R4X5G8_9BURK|nr:PAS domain-containing sensor histidine kinase [Caballeronia insecticola]BAN28207.1 sensory box sensor histidine kinase [Caballeronia insecticola]
MQSVETRRPETAFTLRDEPRLGGESSGEPRLNPDVRSADRLDQLAEMLLPSSPHPGGDMADALRTLFRCLIEAFKVDLVALRVENASGGRFIEIVEHGTEGDRVAATGERQSFVDFLETEDASAYPARNPRGEVISRIFQAKLNIGAMRGVFVVDAGSQHARDATEVLAFRLTARKIEKDIRDELSHRSARVSFARAVARGGTSSVALAAKEGLLVDQFHGRRNMAPVPARNRYVKGRGDQRLRQMFDLVPIMAWSSFPDGTCEFLNRFHSEYTGMSAAQSRQWGWQKAMHPHDLAHRMEKWRESLHSGQPSEAEVRIRRHDGIYRWFLLRIEPFHDASGEIVRWYGAGTDIEDRKRAEENWAASEKRLSLIVNTIPMLIWSCRTTGDADFFNDQWYKYTELTPAQSGGWGWMSALHHDDLQRVTQHWRTVLSMAEQDDVGTEVRFRGKDGDYRWFWLRASAMRDEVGVIKRWYLTSINIHDRKLAEECVRRSEALLAEAQRLTGLGIFSWHAGSNSVTLCDQLYSIFGFEPGTRVDRSMIEGRVHPDDKPFVFDGISQKKRGGKNFEEKLRILMPDGSTKYLHYCIYDTTGPTGKIEYIGTVQDVTEQHLATEALTQARVELAQAVRASSLGVLTASIAHEVNQPLAGILTNANTCLRMLSSVPPNVDGAVETARRTIRDGKRAAAVICRLRELFSHKEINASWWDLRSATHEVIELIQSEVRKNRILVRELHDRQIPLVKGDRIQLQQVLMNLVRNAIDAIKMADGSGPRIVIVESLYKEGRAHLTVQDSGVGFEAGAIDKLFDPFYSTKEDGMGIGLSVSRWIVRAHGGDLWASSNERRGATFGFSIPCQSSSSNENEASEVEPERPKPIL